MSSSQGGEDHREAGNKDSDGSESSNVTDEISHWPLLTRYVPTLFSFCSIVNRVLLIFLLLMYENRLRFRSRERQAADSKAKNPKAKNASGFGKKSNSENSYSSGGAGEIDPGSRRFVLVPSRQRPA
ncbi:conserved hypothetical protein [Agrobacterium tumefaciens str. Kerr 14]|uniref:Uncharacterized protein n=1 Tax=Agrobacterium tumefaciens str. Kerr 14 TaxID=1183424 RepID=A0A1S7QID0_AGRTU|nr:conserved hypothetical protein [Agrobacterium tumefaciens str. Kerr 14]